MLHNRIIYLALLVIGLFSACEKKEYQTIEDLDSENILKYIQDNNLTVTQYKNTDLYYQVLEAGTGRPIDYSQKYPVIFTLQSHDGSFQAKDTLRASNRYYDYFGYFPFSSAYGGLPNSPVERTEDLKEVVKEILQRTNGKIRIIVPSRLTAWGRQGSNALGIPPNASIDYVISVYDDLPDYEDQVIQQSIRRAGFQVSEFTKQPVTGIYYKILQPGTGAIITRDSTVNSTYTLRNEVGTVLDSGTDIKFNLGGGTITAWSEVIPLIRKGGKIRFFTPSPYAYGIVGSGERISPFTPLDFEVEIK